MSLPTRHRAEGAPRRVLLVGWDAADWQMIHPAIERGLMPTLEGMMQRGVWGNLATTRPILSPMLWNNIATGKRPDQHGVHGFTEPTPDGKGVRPSSSTSRKCKAVWNLLTHYGMRTNVVGWYASHPAEPIDGVMVSNQFEHFRIGKDGPTPPPEASVHPPGLADEVAEFRVHPAEIDASSILPFVPGAAPLLDVRDAAEADESVRARRERIGKLQMMLAQTSTVHAVATHLMANTEWDLTAVYYEGIDRFGHEFMEFHPPKMDEVEQEDFDLFQHCMVGIYRFHDMMLQTLLDLAGDDTAVVLISDHGYYNDELRPDPREGKAGPVDWHRPFGVFAAQGPGVREGSRLYGASILDITPTLLQLFGLPAAYDMPGRVLAEVLDEPKPLDRIESWEEIDGPCGRHPPETRTDPADARAVMQQLAALGYIEAPSEDDEQTLQKTVQGNRLQLIQSLVDAQQHEAAIRLIDESDEQLRELTGCRLLLAACLLATKAYPRARSVLEAIAHQDHPRVRMMRGSLEFAEGRPEEALEHLRVVLEAEPRLPGLHNKLGDVYIHTGRYDLAIEAFEKALAIDGDSPLAYVGRARARLRKKQYEGALEDAMVAAELVHQLPRAHFVIGSALLGLGRPDEAIEALEVSTRQAPGFSPAHQALARAYQEVGDADKARAAELRGKRVLR